MANTTQWPMNVTRTSHDDIGENSDPTWLLILAGMGMTVLFLSAVTGNFLVICSYFRNQNLQNIHNIYIVNLAVTDFSIGANSMAFYAIQSVNGGVWMFGSVFCTIMCIVDYSLCLQSLFLIILFSWDRAVLVRKGALYLATETRWMAKVRCGIAWVLSFGIYGAVIILWNEIGGYSILREDECKLQFESSFQFAIAETILELTVPLIVLSFLNVVIYVAIRKKRHVRNHSVRSPSDKSDISIIHTTETTFAHDHNSEIGKASSTVGFKGSVNRKLWLRRDLKAARFLFLLVAVFIVCWAPYTISNLVQTLCDECIDMNFHYFLAWLIWTKSSINPFLYASQSKRFRQNMFALLTFYKSSKRN